MANIKFIHHHADEAAARRIADILYFLDYDVVLKSDTDHSVRDIWPDDFGPNDLMLVLWTPLAQKDPWIVSQCRNMKESDKLVVVVSKASSQHALPLMLHRGCVIRLDSTANRISLAKLQDLLAELGPRTGREGLISCVAALLRKNDQEREYALTQWASANPDDPLANAMQTVVANNTTHEIHRALIELTRRSIGQSGGIGKLANDVASGLPVAGGLSGWQYAAIAAIAAIATGAAVLPYAFSPSDDAPAPQFAEAQPAAQPEPVQTAALQPSVQVMNSTISEADPDLTSDTTEIEEDPMAEEVALPEDEILPEEADFAELPEQPILSITTAETDLVDGEAFEFESIEEGAGALDEAELELSIATQADEEDPFLVAEAAFAEYEAENAEPAPEIAEIVAPAEEAEPGDAEAESAEEISEEELVEDSEPKAELLLPYMATEHGPGAAFNDRLSDDSGAPEMVVIPPGAFMMGSPLMERARDMSEGPQRSVSLGRKFAVSRYEITVEEFTKFVEATGFDAGESCKTYSANAWNETSGRTYRSPGYRQSTSHPVTCVDWYAAKAYADWLSEETGAPYRLLSEAEWEYVARGGSETPYFFGSDADEGCGFMNGADESAPKGIASSAAMSCSDGSAYAARAGSYLPNRFGLHDTLGNVREWTADAWHTSLEGGPGNGSAWTEGGTTDRVARGGSWFTYDFSLRSASRDKFQPNERRYDLGFRVARDL